MGTASSESSAQCSSIHTPMYPCDEHERPMKHCCSTGRMTPKLEAIPFPLEELTKMSIIAGLAASYAPWKAAESLLLKRTIVSRWDKSVLTRNPMLGKSVIQSTAVSGVRVSVRRFLSWRWKH